MEKETYYFSHDYNARNDRKLVKVKLKFRMSGIGIYWSIIEMLFEENGVIPLSEIPTIAGDFREKESTVLSIINDFDLFENDGKVFWSNSAKRRLGKRLEKSNKAKESAKARWENANGMRTHSDSNAIKERKGKEIKGNNKTRVDDIDPELKTKKEKPQDPGPEIIMPFDSGPFKISWDMWKDYRLKEHRKKYKSSKTEQIALENLKSISNNSEETALEIIRISIAQQWQGLFPLKNVTNGANKSTNQSNVQARTAGTSAYAAKFAESISELERNGTTGHTS